MYYEIWIDILFIVNAWIDFLLLRLVNLVLRGTATPIRSMAGACVGASVVCLLTCFPMTPIVNTLLVHVVGNTIMVRFGCNLKKIKTLCAGVLLLYGMTFFMGGFLQMAQGAKKGISIEEILLFGVIGYLVCVVFIRMYTKYITQQENTYKVWIYANGKCKEFTAFLDTGNHLRDPLTQKPVCIMKSTLLEGLCSAKTIEHLRKFQEGTEFEEEAVKLKPHYIPFTSLGCPNGMTLAVTIDFLRLENQRIQKVITRPVIAFSDEGSFFFGNYQMILHPNLIDS